MQQLSGAAAWRRLVMLVALTAGVLAAVALAGGRHVAASTADDIPVYTSTQITAETSTTIQPVTSTTIDPYQAAQVAFYKATIIKKLPPAQPISKLASHGWSMPVPAHCNALCVYAGTILAYNVGVWYSKAGAPKGRVLGRTTVKGTGNLKPRLRIRAAFRRKLLKAHRKVRIAIVQRISDKAHPEFVKKRTQYVTLRPAH